MKNSFSLISTKRLLSSFSDIFNCPLKANNVFLRCGIFGRGGLVVVKTSKPEQDLRFDVPAVGVDTIGVMKKAGGEVLAVEADKTVLIEKEELLQKADAAGISIVAVTPR